MEITEVRVFLRNEQKLKAYTTITLDNCFVVRDLKVIQGNKGLFVAMPSRKKPDGSFKDIAHPLNNETRTLIETKVVEAYKKELENPTRPQHQRQEQPTDSGSQQQPQQQEQVTTDPEPSADDIKADIKSDKLKADIDKSIEDTFKT